METVYDFLKNCGVYYIATLDGDQPRVRPFGTVDIFEGKLYFQTGKKKAVSKQLKLNLNFQISGMYNDKWIRLTGKAVYDDNIEAEKHMLAAYPELAHMYQPGDGNNEVYYISDATAEICSFTEALEVYSF